MYLSLSLSPAFSPYLSGWLSLFLRCTSNYHFFCSICLYSTRSFSFSVGQSVGISLSLSPCLSHGGSQVVPVSSACSCQVAARLIVVRVRVTARVIMVVMLYIFHPSPMCKAAHIHVHPCSKCGCLPEHPCQNQKKCVFQAYAVTSVPMPEQ